MTDRLAWSDGDELVLLTAEQLREAHAGGNEPGHPFWGNQYTGGAGGPDDEEREEAEQNLADGELQDEAGMSMARGEFVAQVEDAIGPRGAAVASDALTIGRSVLGGKVTLQVDPEAQSLLVSTQSTRGSMDRLYRQVGGQLEVEHLSFEVEEEYQGMGHAKEMMGLSMRSYLDNGVAAVNVSAGYEVGGYAWARAGFEARNEGEFRSEVFKSAGWGRLSSERQDELMAGMDKHGTKSPAWLASQPEGRSILLGSQWAGRLDLRSEYGRKVAERFAYGGDE